MKKFTGFPEGSKLSPTAFPSLFFSDLLPMIDDLAELKVVLFSFWALSQKEGRFRYLRREEYDNPILYEGLKAAKPKAKAETTLEHALAYAVERGTLLCTTVLVAGDEVELFFVNTTLGRAAISQIQSGEWQAGFNGSPIEILPERPNIYRLFEANVGLLTPMVADALKDAEKDYPIEWIEDAIRQASENNKRSWRYVYSILKRWEKEGRDRGSEQFDEQDGKRYITGKYADFIEH
ncbi:MAG: DnaD domain protein [Anaerolineae bacterium]